MLGRCFICKFTREIKPVGLKKMGCKEIYICKECDKEMAAPKFQTPSTTQTLYRIVKPMKTVH
jgi:hypothetical protein